MASPPARSQLASLLLLLFIFFSYHCEINMKSIDDAGSRSNPSCCRTSHKAWAGLGVRDFTTFQIRRYLEIFSYYLLCKVNSYLP